MDRTDITGTPAWRGGFEASPLVVIWEVTRACDLACVHCRASAVPKRDPLELSTDEGGRLIRDLRGFGHPVFVLTGGDPLLRPDLETLVAAAAQERFPVALSPAGTPLLSHARLRRLRDAGLGSVSISLDGSCASVHDAFRRVPGSFETSLQMRQKLDDEGPGVGSIWSLISLSASLSVLSSPLPAGNLLAAKM